MNTNDNPLKEPSTIADDETATADHLKKIVERWADIEMLLEQHSRTSELIEETKSYIKDVKSELESLKIIRYVIIAVIIGYIILSNGLLICLIFCRNDLMVAMGPYPATALIVLILSSTAVLLGKTVTGLFKTYGERNKEEFVPPQIKQMVDIVNLVKH